MRRERQRPTKTEFWDGGGLRVGWGREGSEGRLGEGGLG